MKALKSILIWGIITALGAAGFAVIALNRGESINAIWLLTAAVCVYAIAYRFYSKFIAQKVFQLDDNRKTPAELHNDGKDFVPTNKWVLFGHHFAAIAGAGPLVGPILAAQMKQVLINDYVDAALTGIFMLVVIVVLISALNIWFKIIANRKLPLHESPYVPRSEGDLKHYA